MPFADTFEPSAWLDGRAWHAESLVPFSDGPAGCPGRSLVLFTTSTLLAGPTARCDITLGTPALNPAQPLPRTLDHTSLRFRLTPRPDTGPEM